VDVIDYNISMLFRKSIEHRTLFKHKRISFLVISLSFIFFLTIYLVLSFRTIRDSLPPTKIENQKIVGYTQYFGYPFQLDTIIFFLFLLPPLLVGLLMQIKKDKLKDKKKI